MIVFGLWTILVRTALPACIVFENVTLFPMPVLEKAFGDIYAISVTICEARNWLGSFEGSGGMQC